MPNKNPKEEGKEGTGWCNGTQGSNEPVYEKKSLLTSGGGGGVKTLKKNSCQRRVGKLTGGLLGIPGS